VGIVQLPTLVATLNNNNKPFSFKKYPERLRQERVERTTPNAMLPLPPLPASHGMPSVDATDEYGE